MIALDGELETIKFKNLYWESYEKALKNRKFVGILKGLAPLLQEIKTQYVAKTKTYEGLRAKRKGYVRAYDEKMNRVQRQAIELRDLQEVIERLQKQGKKGLIQARSWAVQSKKNRQRGLISRRFVVPIAKGLRLGPCNMD